MFYHIDAMFLSDKLFEQVVSLRHSKPIVTSANRFSGFLKLEELSTSRAQALPSLGVT
jgi:hypothetical protein